MILASARALFRTLPLVMVSGMEVGMPFVRMLALSHALSLRELGLASLLTAAYGTYEQISDLSIYRYVLSAPREAFQEALAGAHALAVTRGVVVSAIAVALSYPMALIFNSGQDWESFALIGVITFVRPFEHLQPRIAERDYNYGIQLKVSLVANTVSLAALAASLLIAPSHVAIIASLLGFSVGEVAASHWLSSEPYRLRFRSPEFIKAFKFGYPLIAGGVGVAVSSQADRFLVGGMLGLEALGVYAVLTLAALVPISMVYRILNTVTVAILINAEERSGVLLARLKLAGRIVPIVAGAYAIGVATLLNIVVPLVFGTKFVGSRAMVAWLAICAFVRIVRIEPGNSILLYRGRTKRLAIANLVALSSVPLTYLSIRIWGNMEAAVGGRAAGEFLGLLVMLSVIRQAYGTALRDNVASMFATACLVALTCASVVATPVGAALGPSLAVLAAYFAASAAWLAAFAPRLLRAAEFGFAH
jgi:O-antigen/teichoic acid export membrane protein